MSDTNRPGHEASEYQNQDQSGTTAEVEAEERGSIVSHLARPGTEHDAARDDAGLEAGAAGPLGRAYLTGVIARLADPGHPASLARQEPELEAGS